MIKPAVGNDSALEAITDTIVVRFKPQRIVLFGSHARGDARKDSDYDLMVEFPGLNDAEAWETRCQIKQALPLGVDVDITVRTRANFEERRDDPGTLDWAIAREGIVIYPLGADSSSIRPVARVREGGEPPKSIGEWLEIADEDILVVEKLASGQPVAWRAVCFHAQQSGEKYLKALLVRHGIHPPRTHHLTELLSEIRKAGSPFVGLDVDCALLSTFPVEPRYPSDVPKPDAVEGNAAVHAMRRVVGAATAAIGAV